MRKLIIFVMVLTSLVFLVDAASASVIALKGTHTQAQVDIACTRAGGGSTAGRGHGGFGCKTSEGEVKCNDPTRLRRDFTIPTRTMNSAELPRAPK